MKCFAILLLLVGFENPNEYRVIGSTHVGETWLKTKIVVKPGDKLVIIANGSIDLNPGSHGEDICGPNGFKDYNRKGYPDGCLLGKIGNGETFFVGKIFDRKMEASGVLYLKINYNNSVVGSFVVTVK